ncbi:SPFH domain-containing protein, partial [Streptomyces endophyticus]|nr:SPFH domain-containing protein [Streptomyces endophyticus]
MTETDGGARAARLIRNESTTEIPVHLLFRDDPDPVAVPLRPAVVTKAQVERSTATGPGRTPKPAPVRTPRRPAPS